MFTEQGPASEETHVTSVEVANLSPEQTKMLGVSDIQVSDTHIEGEIFLSGDVTIENHRVWISLEEKKRSNSDVDYFVFIRDEKGATRWLYDKDAKRLFDFYYPIAKINTPQKHPSTIPSIPIAERIEDKLLGI